MASYLLDTTALIDFSKNRNPVTIAILKIINSDNNVGICAIVVTEFFSGIPDDKKHIWEEFISSFSYWDISLSAAKQAGRYRYTFAKKGKSISTMDATIAAVAKENNAVIITNNVKDYPMKDIEVLSFNN